MFCTERQAEGTPGLIEIRFEKLLEYLAASNQRKTIALWLCSFPPLRRREKTREKNNQPQLFSLSIRSLSLEQTRVSRNEQKTCKNTKTRFNGLN